MQSAYSWRHSCGHHCGQYASCGQQSAAHGIGHQKEGLASISKPQFWPSEIKKEKSFYTSQIHLIAENEYWHI